MRTQHGWPASGVEGQAAEALGRGKAHCVHILMKVPAVPVIVTPSGGAGGDPSAP